MEVFELALLSPEYFELVSLDTHFSFLSVSKHVFSRTYPQILASLSEGQLYDISPGGTKLSLDLLCKWYPSNLLHLLSKPNILRVAAWGGHLGMLQKAMAHGGDLSTTTFEEETLLHLGGGGGDEGVVSFLLSKGLSAHAVDRNGNQPLHIAAMLKKSSVIPVLVHAGADVNKRDKDDNYMAAARTPLHIAFMSPKRSASSLKLQHRGGHGNILQQLPLAPQSPEEQHQIYDCVQQLLSCGANPILTDVANQSALDYAAFFGPLSAVQLLMKRFPSLLPLEESREDVEIKNMFIRARGPSHSPLQFAAASGQLAIVKELLSHVPSYSPPTVFTGLSPLGMAVHYNQLEVFKLLLERDFLRAEPHPLFLPLQSRLQPSEVLNYIQIMMEKGVDVNRTDTSRSTPLHLAVQKGLVESVRFLLDTGADVNWNDMMGRSCLDCAVAPTLNEEIAKMILEKDITNIDQQDWEGNTVLHKCLLLRNTTLVEALIGKGATVTVKNKQGIRPIDLIFNGATDECLQLAFMLQESKLM